MGYNNYYQARTFLLVHHPGVENQNRFFQNATGLHAEENFMNAYGNEYANRYQNALSERVKLDMYLTYAPCGARGKSCAKQLRDFAEDYKFDLNIKAAAPYYQNIDELCYLMTSKYCTVEAFTEQDYIDLAQYLGIEEVWGYAPKMRERDEETRLHLKKIQYGEYGCINMQCRY